jgi:hypothetical protein
VNHELSAIWMGHSQLAGKIDAASLNRRWIEGKGKARLESAAQIAGILRIVALAREIAKRMKRPASERTGWP